MLGHNNPPSAIDLATEARDALSAFLKGTPVVESADEAKQAKLQLDRGNAAVEDLERERRAIVDPLNRQVKDVNDRYRPIREPLERIVSEIKARMAAFARREEDKRRAAAELARVAAAEAERLAREAEAREREAVSDAAMGVETDVGTLTVEADAAFSAFQRQTRFAARAERETKVRIAGGFSGRAMTLRTTETLTVTDWKAAIDEMGLTDTIRDAILTSARGYRKQFNELPAGITRTTERTI